MYSFGNNPEQLMKDVKKVRVRYRVSVVISHPKGFWNSERTWLRK